MTQQLDARASTDTAAADAIDVAGYQQALIAAQARRRDIDAAITLSEQADAVRAEVSRLRERASPHLRDE